MYTRVHVKQPLLLSDFNETWIFSTYLMRRSPVGSEFFHADRQADMTKLTVAFRNFANAPKNHININVGVTDCATVNLIALA
jgi:hypothetical protein